MTGLLLALIFGGAYPLAAILTWLAGAWRIGQDAEAITQRALKAREERWERLDYLNGEYVFWSFARAWSFVVALGLFWPVAIPLAMVYRSGRRGAVKRKQLQTLLTAAEQEIERIKQQEGWK